ncbi:MAG TPA: thiosulfate oxidation carrier complex protein SoxZ [Burkholderiales bacterium]|jgi:sulfur-oxidizing protein SoxZ|nr:thiosulfate oxidation carrier complex protein SoxZ [Burkholderiales bacterium]
MALSRIRMPEAARRGELVEVSILIQHPMETGFRRELNGERVPRNAIHSFRCRYNGVDVFRATLSTGIAANPTLRFFFVATETADVEFWWLDDDEVEGGAKARLSVT